MERNYNTYARKGRVYGRQGTVPAISAHIAKDAEYLVRCWQ